tara:strand:- start:449 stop:844 length:396 start_codon:yes stop_codon:yes gene_type:complete
METESINFDYLIRNDGKREGSRFDGLPFAANKAMRVAAQEGYSEFFAPLAMRQIKKSERAVSNSVIAVVFFEEGMSEPIGIRCESKYLWGDAVYNAWLYSPFLDQIVRFSGKLARVRQDALRILFSNCAIN